jgi:hypothetical protein
VKGNTHHAAAAHNPGAFMPLSFAQDIRSLFRDKDIDSMKDFGDFDLAKASDVRANAAGIYDRLALKDMPCDQPWSDDHIAKFKQWMEEGMAD